MKIDIVKATRESAILQASRAQWIAVQRCVSLGLQHEQSFGLSRELVVEFLGTLNELIVEAEQASAPLETTLVQWLAVHGCLCMGLRQPQSFSLPRELVLQFLDHLGGELVQRGLFSQAELAAAMEVEREVRLANLNA
jgi:hypothetical protein